MTTTALECQLCGDGLLERVCPHYSRCLTECDALIVATSFQTQGKDGGQSVSVSVLIMKG